MEFRDSPINPYNTPNYNALRKQAYQRILELKDSWTTFIRRLTPEQTTNKKVIYLSLASQKKKLSLMHALDNFRPMTRQEREESEAKYANAVDWVDANISDLEYHHHDLLVLGQQIGIWRM